MKIEKSLLSGSTPLLVLSLLKDGDKYGYEMVDTLARRSDDTSYTKDGPGGRERKYYRLTDEGRSQLEHKTEEWKLFSQKVNAVLGGAAPCTL